MDDASRATWVFLMCEKSEASRFIQSFIVMAFTQFGKKVKVVRSDNGSEFTSNPMQVFYQVHGIFCQNSYVDTPQQNGRLERKQRHVLNVARALLFEANLPKKFWGESVLAATHLINRTPSKLLSSKTPYEILHNKAPVYDHL